MIMERPSKGASFLLLLCWLGVSWGARLPRPLISSNATIFSHVYTIKVAGEDTPNEGASPPPQEALGPPGSSRGGGQYEHTLEGSDQEHVVFTHRINLPQQSCGCPPGTEDTQELWRRLQALENEVRVLQETCQAGGGCCPAASTRSQASEGQTDIRTLCSHHGSFDLSRCLCECESGWGGPTCAEPVCSGGCGGPERGRCLNGHCQCQPGYSGVSCEEPPSCPDDCNDQGRCVDGRCTCFPGYMGPSCSDPVCPQNCHGHGQCISGRCVCNPGYSGADCASRACPSNCNRRGECRNGRCVCEPGFIGPACGTKTCPNDCNQRGHCLQGGVCSCHPDYTGPDCGQLACPEHCSGHGECQNGTCVCNSGYSGDDCSIEIPSIGVRVSNRDETSFRLEWNYPEISVDGYEIHVAPKKDPRAGESIHLSGTERLFEYKGLKPGEEYTVTVRVEKGQHYGPPVTQTVRTRVAPPTGLQSPQVSGNSLTLQWEPPTSRPDGYILSYIPLVSTRPVQAMKRIELPAAPERVTLEDLESRTRYRITLVARQSGENSRATSIVVSTTAPAPIQPSRNSLTPPPSSHKKPDTPSSEPEEKKPGTKPHLRRRPTNTTLLTKEHFLKRMTQNISSKLSPYNGTLLERLESYLRAINFPLRGNQTIQSVARDIYLYLKRMKPIEFQERVEERLVQETSNLPLKREFPITEAESVYSDGYLRPDHAKPTVVTSSPDHIEVSLDSVRGISDHVVIRYRNMVTGERKELVVPGDASTATITGLSPGTTYLMEIHGVMKGHSSKSYSFITATAPSSPTNDKIQTISPSTSTPEDPLKNLQVTKVSPNQLRVTWSAPPDFFHKFSLYYRDPKSGAPPKKISIPGTERSVDLMDLHPGTDYEIELHGERPGGSYNAPFSTKIITAPSSPTNDKIQTISPSTSTPEDPLKNLQVTKVSPNQLRVTWSAPPDFFHKFSLYYRDPKSGAPPKKISIPGTERSVDLMDLHPGTDYEIELHGERPGGSYNAPFSTKIITAPSSPTNDKIQTISPPASTPEDPLKNLQVTEVSPNQLRVTWSAPPNFFHKFFLYYRDPKSGAPPKKISIPGIDRSVDLMDLHPGTDYEIELHGERPGGSYSAPFSTKIITAPSSPTNDKIQTISPSTSTPKDPLNNLQVTKVSPNQLRVTWSAPPNFFHKFSLYYRDPKSGAPPKKISIPGTERSVDLMDLHPGTDYEIELHGERPGGSYSAPFSTKIITAPSSPTNDKIQTISPPASTPEDPLKNLQVTEVSPNQLRVTWSAPPNFFHKFSLYYRDPKSGAPPKKISIPGTERSVDLMDLHPGTDYEIELHGERPGGSYSAPFSTKIITEAEPKEPRPGDFSLLEVTDTSVHLSWGAPTGPFDSFVIQYKDAEGKPKLLKMDKNSREATISNLVPSRKYKFNLYVLLGRKPFGPVSLEVIPGSTGKAPAIFKDISATVTSNSAHLSWTVSSGNFDSFLIQYKDAEGRLQELFTEGDSHEITIPNLTPSHRYTIDLYGISNQGRLGPASITFITGSQEDVSVHKTVFKDLAVSEVTSNSAHLTWRVPSGRFDSFLVQYQDLEGNDQTLNIDGDSHEVIIPNLVPSQRYRFNLYGILGTQLLGPLFADAVTAAVQEPKKEKPDETVVSKPSLGEFSVLDVTSDTVRLYWTVPTGRFDSFLIQYKDVDGQPQALPVEGDSREVTVTNLAPSRRYKFNLYGVFGRKRSRPLSTDATTAHIRDSEKPIPVQPSLGEFSVLDVMSDSVRLHWTVPTGSFESFLIQYKDADGQPQALPVEGDSREITVTNLAPSRRYKFNLYGVSGRKRSTPLSTDATTAQTTEPEKPASFQSSLGELSVLDVTSDSVRLHWTVSTGSFDSFLIQYKDADGQPQALPVEGDSHEVTLTNLVPSRRYKFNLYGVSGRKRSNPISTFATTARLTNSEEQFPVQSSLGEFSVLDVTSDSVRLHWTISTGSFESFLIQYKDADGQPQALPVDGDTHEVTVTNLAPSHRYKFNLYGVSGKKHSRPLATEAITESEEPIPVQPSLGEFSVLDVTSDSVRLYWTVSTGSFDSFLIQYKDGDGQPQALPVEGNSREVTVTSLAPSHRYKFNLYGVSGRKRSSPLSTDATTVPLVDSEEPVPIQPRLGEFSVVDVTSNSVRLYWTVPTGSFDSFLIQYKDADGQPQALPIDGGSQEVTVTSLAPSHRYKFNLYGVSGRKRSGPLSTDATTAHVTDTEDSIPVQPSLGDFSILDVTSDSVRLHWTVPTGRFDSFLVQYKDADGQPQALPVEGDSREVTVTNLVPSRRYKFNLYGVSGRKRSGPLSTDATTARLTATEEPIPVQPSLGEFSILDVTSDSVHLYWTVPTGIFDSFLIQYKDADGQPQVLPVEGDSREVTVTNLVPSRRYKFNLYGVSGHKRSGPLSTDATTGHLTDSEETNPVQSSLGEFAALDITSNSVRLYWTVSTGRFDSFLIQYKDGDGQPQALPVEGDTREVTVTNLAPSQRYKFNLYGISGRKRSNPLSTDATTDLKEAIPVQPSLGEFTFLDVTSNSVRLYWTVPTGNFDSFLIQYKDADGQPQALPVEGGSNEVTVTNLAPSHRYKFNLYGISGRKRSTPLSTDAITAHLTNTAKPIPVQPSLGEFSVLDVTSDSVHLHWTVPTGNFDSFLIQYKDADGQPQALPVDGDSREVTVSNLVPSRRYKFNLYGITGRKRSSPFSTDATTVSKEAISVQPSLGELSVLDITTDSVRLHWTVPTGSFDSFLVQYKDADGQPQALPVEGDSREVTVTNLAPFRRYKFNLYGVSGRKRSGPLSTDATTAHLTDSKEPIPVQPSLGEFSVLDVTSDSVRLHWTVPTGSFDSFLVQYKDADGQPQALPVEGGSNEVTVTNLVPSRKYKFNLYGVSGRKRSRPLSTEATTDSEEPIPIQPSLGEFSVLDVTSDSVRLYWTVPTGNFDSFLVQYKDADGQPQALPIDGGSQEVTVTNLVPSHKYKFNLYGISGRKRSSPLSTDATTGSEDASPPQPSLGEFSVLDVTSDSIQLHWTVPTGSFDSFLVQYKDADGQPQALPAEGDSREVTVTNLVPSRRYKFNLYGVSGRKRSAPLSTNATTAHLIVVEEPIPVQPSLGEFSVFDVSSDSVHLHWTVSTGSFDSFLVQYKDADGQPQALPVEGDSREVTVTNLVPSRRYKFNLYGVSGRKRSRPLSTDATTARLTDSEETNPVQPSLGEFSVLDVTSDSVRLYWTVSTGSFDSFLIQYKDGDGQPQALPVEGNSREVTMTNLAPSHRYKFNLYGVSGSKRSSPLSTDATTVPLVDSEEPVPIQPSLGEFSVVDVTSDSVRLYWTVPTGSFDSFLIQYKDADGQPQALPIDGGSQEVTVTSLAPSHRYKFNLYGVSGRKRSGPLSTDATTAHLTDTEEPIPVQPSLGEFSVLDVTSDSVRLYWTVPTGRFDSFLVQYKDADGQPQALPVEGDSREVTVTNLVPSRRYKFNLYGVSGRKRSRPLSTDATTARVTDSEEPIPVQPSLGEFSVLNVTSDSVRLHWTVPTGSFDSFLIQYKDGDDQPQMLPVERGSREVTVTNLAPSHRYKFNLYGVSGRKRSSPLSTDATTAQTTDSEVAIPIQPTLGELSVLDITSNSVRLYWTVPTGTFDSFLVQYKDADGQPQVLPVDGSSREVTVTNLAPSHKYKFLLYGVSGRQKIRFLSADVFTEPPLDAEEPIPVQPTLGELSVLDVTSDSVHLHWTVPTGSFDSFLIQYRDSDGQPQVLTVEGGSTEVTVTNLVPSHRYKFNLYGISGDKYTSPFSIDATTTGSREAVPIQPSLGELSVLDITTDSVRLHWTVPTGSFDSFLVQYKDADGQPQALPVEGDSHEVTVTNLVPSRRYKFNLYGVSGRKRSGPLSTDATTARLTATEEPIPVQPSLGEFSILDVTSDSVRLHWTIPTGSFDSFLVQYKDADGQPQALPVEGGSNEVTVTNLVPSRRYKFNLYGVSGRKRSGPLSTDATTAPLATTPLVQPSLGELSVSNITHNSALLSWTVHSGSFDSFMIQYKDMDGKPQAVPVEGNTYQVVLPNLTPARRYKFNLYGVSGRKRFGPISADAITATLDLQDPVIPPSLGELSASEITSNSVRLSWTVLTGRFDSFAIQYKDAEGQPQAIPVEGDLHEITIPDLVPSRKYKFNLYGLSGRKRMGPVSVDTITASTTKKEATPKPSLGELSISEATSNSVLLSWTISTGRFDSFLLQYKDEEGRTQTLTVEGDSHEVTVLNLAPSHKYKFNLYGIFSQKRIGPISSEATTAEPETEEEKEKKDEDGENQPSLGELSISETTSDSLLLSWSVPSGSFDSFLIQYEDGALQSLPVDGVSRRTMVSNLTPSHSYQFDLYGISGGERLGPISANALTAPRSPSQGIEESGSPGPSPNPSFGELSVSDVTGNSARLSWNVPAETFDSFQIQYKDAENKPQIVPVDKETNTIVIYYLVPSHRYKFNLYSISGRRRFGPITASIVTAPADNEKPSGMPGEVDQEVPAGISPRLGVLSVPEVTSHSAQLSWTVPEGSFDSFSVQYKDAEGRPQALPLRGDFRDVIVSNLSPSHKYKFNLYGIFGKQRLGPISAQVVTTAAETSGKIEEKKQPEESTGKSNQPRLGDVTVSEVTPDSLLLSWTIQEGSFDSFIIQYKDASGNPQTVPVDGAMRSLHLYNLTHSQTYEFDIFGVSGFRHLGPHSVHTVTEISEGGRIVQPQLGDLSVSRVTNDSVALFWTVAVGNFDSYLLQYKDSEGKPQVLPLNGTSRDVTVTNLAPSHRYKFNLYGLSGRKRLGPVSTNAVTGQGTQPLKLGTLSAHNITSESLLLSWVVESGNFDSFIIQYRDAAGKSHALPVDGGLRLLRFHDLVPSHRYKFNLYGVSRRKRLGPISVEAVTVPKPSGLQVAPQPKLGKLSASDISDTTLRLTWRVLTGKFESFSIEYRDAEGNPQVLPIDTSARDAVISNLVPSHRYKFNLYGISQQKRFGPISTEAVTAQGKHSEAKPKLGDLSISDVTNDSVRLSWTISSGKFDSFLIQYKDAQGNPQTVPVGVDSQTVFISNLIPSHKYKFSLYGLSGKKQFGPVSIDAVTAAFSESTSTPAPLLDHLVVSEVTSTTLQLGWDVPEGEFDSFLVRWKDSLGSGQTAVPAKEVKVPGDGRSVTLQGLAPSTEYSLTVYGIKDESEVAEINTGARTSGLELDGPQDLRFSDIHETSVVANWRPPSSRIDGYKVSFQPSDGGEPKSIPVDGSELRTIIEGLTPGASYEVAVMSIRGFEESEPLVGYITTVPDGPSNLRAVNVTDTSAVLTWRPAVAEMNNYIVTYGPITSTGSQVSESVPGNRVQLQLSELQRDMEYWANVYGEKEGNRSSPISATFTTGADGPRDLHAMEISPRSARLTWSPPGAPSEGYLLSYETPDGQSKEIPLDASVTSYELQDLIPSSRYQVQVQAVRRGTPTAPISTSFTTGHLTYPFPRDCSEEIQNGPGASRITTIYLGGNRERPLRVFCDMETDGGGWIVFQRRMNGETDFWRDWQNYALGFGNLTREFWLGNNALHQLTSSGDYELRVDLRAGDESVYATYQNFRVDPPADHYRLHLGSYHGTAGDALSYHSGSVFSTRDRDPNRVIIPCAISYRGAWWYRNCHYTNLNGLYANNRDHQGVNWFNWKGFEFSIPFTEMKLRPSSFHPLQRS
ncbi:tenascin-X [Pituophis catenifer annectens]|uniref:tenascin-X n=1 Tax=Pituophis catenifer annectens TaxID=94852 RepID=UPI0039953344